MSRYSQEDKKDDVQAYVGSPAVAEYDTEKGMAVVDGHTAILVNEPRKSRICSSRLSLTSLVNAAEGGVHRTLKQRHMAMIAIGGAIGTGMQLGFQLYLRLTALLRSLCRVRRFAQHWWARRCLARVYLHGFDGVSVSL